MIQNKFVINSRKLDGKIHRTWTAILSGRDDAFLEFYGTFEKEVIHPELGVIRPGTVSVEYFWLDRWYNIFRFHEPNGELRNYYCNVNLPPTVNGNVLNYVDLDIDIVVWKDFSYQILDRAEFEVNKIKYAYSEEIIINVNKALEQLITLIEKKDFPFDSQI